MSPSPCRIALACAMVVLPMQPAVHAAAAGPAALAGFDAVQRYPVGGTGGWDFVTFDPAGQRLFITRGDRVQVWSVQSKAVVAEIEGTAGVHGVALAPDLGRGFTSNGRSNTVSVFGLDDLRITRTIPVGESPDAILYEPHFKRVYAFNARSRSVSIIDAVGLTVLATVPLGGKPEVGVADNDGRVFVNIEDKSELAVIDPAGNRVEARWPLAPCLEPTGLALDAVHARLFSVCANHTMAIVDATSGRLVAAVPIGGEPDGVVFDAGSRRAFSANGEGSVTVVGETDAEHFVVLANVATQARARTIALDPASHALYLVTASFGPTPAATAEQPRPRPAMLKDSFVVLVLPAR